MFLGDFIGDVHPLKIQDNLEVLEHHKYMNVSTVFGTMYIATTKSSLINNKNINTVGNKKICSSC